MATIDYVSDWAARLRSRLYTQFRSAVTWGQWTDMLGAMAQDWEDAAQTLLTLLDIDASSGVQLDTIGRVVGQPRLGVVDSTYRLYLRARILANRSTGTAEEIYAVFAALLGAAAPPQYIGGWVKQFAIRVGAAITRVQAVAAANFLGVAKEAGARGLVEWQEYADSQMFEFSSDPILLSPITAGAAFIDIVVSSTSGFSSSGSVTFYKGTPSAVTVTYDTKTATVFSRGAPASVTVDVSVGQPVSTTTLGTGLGLDDGYFAGAIQA